MFRFIDVRFSVFGKVVLHDGSMTAFPSDFGQTIDWFFVCAGRTKAFLPNWQE